MLPSLFDDLFENFYPTPYDYSKNGNRQMQMKSDLQEFETYYELTLQLPGFKKNEIKAELKKGYLTISARHEETKDDTKKENGKYVWKESYSGEYIRSFYVGETLEKEQIKARFENGELEIIIPKNQKPKIEKESFIAID